MLKKVLIFAAIALFALGVGCSNGTNPVIPDKDGQMEAFFNTFDLSDPVVGEVIYKDFDGNVLGSATLGRDGDKLYVIEERGAQISIDLTPLNLVNIWVTYNNPAGTIPTGPNAGLPYYYIGQTMDYDINIMSLLWMQIGWPCGSAELTVEMRYASFNCFGQVVPGGLMPGEPTFTWNGIISPGYQSLNDTFTIVPGTCPGLNVTTARLTAPIFFGCIDIIFFDGIAGIWDPQ